MSTPNTTIKSRLAILLQPAFLVALVLLVLNDHVFKQTYPSWLTGKLSDFAGLMVFSVFCYAVFPRWINSRKAVTCLHVLTGLAFIVWKVAPVEVVLSYVNRISGLPVPGRVKDVTDLIALAILPVSHVVIRNFESGCFRVGMHRATRRMAAGLILLATGWSIVATSDGLGLDELRCCVEVRGNVDGDTMDIVDTNDVVYLTNYLRNNGPRPPCLLEADVDCSGDKNPVTEEDLEYLIDYLYNSGPPPCDCP